MMLRRRHTAVNVPFQALVDDGLLDTERLTLAILYAYADEFGYVDQTPMTLDCPRDLHRNSVRRHICKLESLRYLISLHKGTRLSDPQRRLADGYQLALKPDGSRFDMVPGAFKIGSIAWDSDVRWSDLVPTTT